MASWQRNTVDDNCRFMMAYVHETITCSVPLFQEFAHKVELCFCDSGHGKIIVLSVKIRYEKVNAGHWQRTYEPDVFSIQLLVS